MDGRRLALRLRRFSRILKRYRLRMRRCVGVSMRLSMGGCRLSLRICESASRRWKRRVASRPMGSARVAQDAPPARAGKHLRDIWLRAPLIYGIC